MAFELFTGKASGRGAHRKLTEEEVADIRRAAAIKTQAGLAAAFGVHPSHISRILSQQARTGKPPKCSTSKPGFRPGTRRKTLPLK